MEPAGKDPFLFNFVSLMQWFGRLFSSTLLRSAHEFRFSTATSLWESRQAMDSPLNRGKDSLMHITDALVRRKLLVNISFVIHFKLADQFSWYLELNFAKPRVSTTIFFLSEYSQHYVVMLLTQYASFRSQTYTPPVWYSFRYLPLTLLFRPEIKLFPCEVSRKQCHLSQILVFASTLPFFVSGFVLANLLFLVTCVF